MRTLIVACVLFTFAASVDAQAQDKKFVSKDGKFEAKFPLEPMTESKKVGDSTMVSTAVETKGVGYMVIYADLPAGAAKAKAEDILAGGEKGLVDDFKATVTKSTPTMFGKDKLPARDVTAEVVIEKMVLRLRLKLVVVNGRLYQVIAIGTKESIVSKDVDTFFESFEIVK